MAEPPAIPYKTVAASLTTVTELMIPSYANFGGKIHGGILLSLMDKAAYACASKHAGGYCVTVSVDGVDFLQPVDVGDLVSMHAAVHYVGRNSMLIGITVLAENVMTGQVKHTNTSYFTMVAKGDDDRPREVPGLILESAEEVRRFLEGKQRRELKNRYQEQLRELHARLAAEDDAAALSGERCLIRPSRPEQAHEESTAPRRGHAPKCIRVRFRFFGILVVDVPTNV